MAGIIEEGMNGAPLTTDSLQSGVERLLACSEGKSIDEPARAAMESRLNHDFGSILIHTGGEAAELAKAIDALAYTVGRHIVFAPGQYAPWTRHGQTLLAHELAHVVHQASAGPRVQLADRAATGESLTPPGIRLRLFFDLEDGPSGLSIGHVHWDPAVDLPEGVSGGVLDDLIQKAAAWVVTFSPEVLDGEFATRRVEFKFTLEPDALATEPERGRLVHDLEIEIKNAIKAARTFEKPAEPPPRPAERRAKTGALTERIQRAREEMKRGFAEQTLADSMAGQLAAFLAVTPEPDMTGWDSPDEYFRMAERTLRQGDLDLAKGFVELGEGRLESQQTRWEQYQRSYDFGDEVIAPVFWKALQLTTMGLVDRTLFEVSEEASRQGFLAQLAAVGTLVAERLFGIVTFGGGPAAYSAVVRYWREHPDEGPWTTLAGAIVAGGEEAFEAVLMALIPVQQMAVVFGVKVGPEAAAPIDPTAWQRLEALFEGLLQLANTAHMASTPLGGRRLGGKGAGEKRLGEGTEPTPKALPSGSEPSQKPVPAATPVAPAAPPRFVELQTFKGELTDAGVAFLQEKYPSLARKTATEVRADFHEHGWALEAVVREEMRRHWREMNPRPSEGRALLAEPKQNMLGLLKELQKIAAKRQPPLKLTVNRALLEMTVKQFIEAEPPGSPVRGAYDALERNRRARFEWEEFKWRQGQGTGKGFLAETLADLEPDAVEVFLESKAPDSHLTVTDITQKKPGTIASEVHQFKTLVYRIVLQRLTGIPAGALDYPSGAQSGTVGP